MTGRLHVRSWSSASGEATQAVELIANSRPLDLKKALTLAAAEVGDAAFVLVPIDAAEPASIAPAIAAYARAGGKARLCLAGHGAALATVGDAALEDDGVGLMLDGVDADTPLSQLAWDRIEAVRFDADFVALAGRNLRLGCVLQAMLALAHDLGLCTLGADTPPAGAPVKGRWSFDYLPSGQARPIGVPRAAAREMSTARGR